MTVPSSRIAPLAFVVWALLCVAPAATQAQPAAGKLHRIGMLEVGGVGSSEANQAAFRQGLRDLGYEEGRHFVIEHRSAQGRTERLADLATELVRSNVDVIVTEGSPAALGARHVTDTIPIVMATSGEPVFHGLVASLARPGGNVTGLHVMVPPETAGHRLRLLKELVPGATRVGVMLDAGDVYAKLMMQELEKVGRVIGIQLRSVETRRPEELDRAFEAALLDRVDALIAVEGILTRADLTRIVEFAAMSRLPAVYGGREFADAGGLMAYGADVRDLFRRSATYVHKILQGARPADLPVEPPAKLALTINLKTAGALGLAIPPALLRRADDVIR